MKKFIAVVLVLACVLALVACANSKDETVSFHEKTFIKSDLSVETLEWLEWYNGLTESEQLAISYIPADLLDYGNAEEIAAETE